MASTKRNGKYVDRILKALRDGYGVNHPQARIDAYRYNPASIRVRVIDPDFAGKNRVARNKIVWPIIAALPEDIVTDVTMVILLTPEECKRSTANIEFENPTRLEELFK